MKVVDFSSEEIRDIFKLLSGTLHLGNVEFMTAGGAQVTTKAGKWDPRNLVSRAKPHKTPSRVHSAVLSPSPGQQCLCQRIPCSLALPPLPHEAWLQAPVWFSWAWILSNQVHNLTGFSFALKEQDEIGARRSFRLWQKC